MEPSHKKWASNAKVQSSETEQSMGNRSMRLKYGVGVSEFGELGPKGYKKAWSWGLYALQSIWALSCWFNNVCILSKKSFNK